MIRMIKANEEIPEDALVIDIEFIYTEEIIAANYINYSRKGNKSVFPNHKAVIDAVKPILTKNGFNIINNPYHTKDPTSASTYYDTIIKAKKSNTNKAVFIRVSDHFLSKEREDEKEPERKSKAQKYLGIDDAIKDKDYFYFPITVQGKRYNDWGKTLSRIKREIESYSKYDV